jgi:YVTN family beta-propeller protein
MSTLPRILLASLGLALALSMASADTVRIYVTNSAGDRINVIDAATNKVVQTFKGPEAMHGVNFSPDGARVYVSNESESTLDVFDRRTGKRIKQVALSNRPNNIAVAKDGRIVVGIARGEGALDIVDPGSLALKKSIPVHGRLHNVYVTPDGKYAIAGSIPNKMLTVIDLATEAVAWEAPMSGGVRPMAIETNPDGSTKRIFAQLSDLNGFAVVDFADRKEVARVELPKLKDDFETDGGRNSAPSHGIGVLPDNKTLWVTSIPNNAVYVYSLADLKLTGHVDLPALKVAGHEPISAVANWVTITPDGKTLYVANSGLRSVTAIDTARMKVKKVVKVGEVPKRINTLVLRGDGNATPPSDGRRESLL